MATDPVPAEPTEAPGAATDATPTADDHQLYRQVALALYDKDDDSLTYRARRFIDAGLGSDHARELAAVYRRRAWVSLALVALMALLTPSPLLFFLLLMAGGGLHSVKTVQRTAEVLALLEAAGLAPSPEGKPLPPAPPTVGEWWRSLFGRPPTSRRQPVD